MKRTPLKRKIPLKNSGNALRNGSKKAKAKSVSWYRKHVIEQFMSRFRGQPCEICGVTHGTCAHHVVSKQRNPGLILEPKNCVVLCCLHHRFSNDIAPHSFNSLAVGRFLEWLKTEKAWQYEWVKLHEHDTIKMNWKEIYESNNRA